jgi:hypothetical protein
MKENLKEPYTTILGVISLIVAILVTVGVIPVGSENEILEVGASVLMAVQGVVLLISSIKAK